MCFTAAASGAKKRVEDAVGRDIDRVGQAIIENKYATRLAVKLRYSRIGQAAANRFYRLYTWNLLRSVRAQPAPHHVAIIMDGNRRFAKKLGVSIDVGHLLGREKLHDVIEWCRDADVKILTIYAFSMENFKRESKEVNELMRLFGEQFKKIADEPDTHTNKIKINTIGNLSVLPKDVQESITYAVEKTKDYNKFILNIAIAYGGREEIVHAIKKIVSDTKADKLAVGDITEDLLSSYLYTKDMPDPDLILRTSGEERISNFLLWQLAYSELSFVDVSWPEFRKMDFLRAVRNYQTRERRYGK